MVMLLLNIVNGICEMSWVTGEAESKLYQLLAMPVAEETSFLGIGASTSYFTIAWDKIQVLWGMFWFDYAFFTGPWVYLRFFFIAIGAGIIISLVWSLIGRSSAG